jgi:hypothetical protein
MNLPSQIGALGVSTDLDLSGFIGTNPIAGQQANIDNL